MDSHVPVIGRLAKLFITNAGLMSIVASAIVLIRCLSRLDI